MLKSEPGTLLPVATECTMPIELPVRVHATTIAIADRAAIIRGASGAGKSDLALRCLMMAPNSLVAQPVQLVADDYTELFFRDNALFARAPEQISRLLEVRGLGIVDMETTCEAEVALVVDLVDTDELSRLPDPSSKVLLVEGISVPALRLSTSEPSAPAKLLLALDYIRRHGRLPDLK